MAEINETTTVEELAGIVATALEEQGIQVALVGGAVVSIYTHGEYESGDLDFVVYNTTMESRVDAIMSTLGFHRDGRMFTHPSSSFFVEFPPGPISIGRNYRVELDTMKMPTGVVRLLSPTDCVCDRLAAFFHWNDRRSLEHALMVASNQPIHLNRIKKWSAEEGGPDVAIKFQEFEQRYAAAIHGKARARKTGKGEERPPPLK
ncbi:MAG: hypothetical protein AAB229_00465 [Candidatus Hydrogenedentota bacterium]